jgi:hypothetical protein
MFNLTIFLRHSDILKRSAWENKKADAFEEAPAFLKEP